MRGRTIDSVRRSGTLLAGLALLATAGCVETEIQGVILNEDIRQTELMLPMVRGVNSEMIDVWRGTSAGNVSTASYLYLTAAPTDEITNDGTATSEERISASDYRDRPGDFIWEQTHEAAWAGYHAVSILEDVLGDAADSSPLTAQALITSGWSERMLGETFCEVVYNYGPGAGTLIGDNSAYDPTRLVPADSAFRRAVTAFSMALSAAENAVASGAPTPDDDPIFAPQSLVYKARGGLAQAYAALGEWAMAATHAAQVPDDFVAYIHHNEVVGEENDFYHWFYNNDDLTMWNTPAATLFAGDPRAPITICGEFRGGPRTQPGSAGEIVRVPCDSPSNEFRAESNTVPMYRSDKYSDEGDDIAMVKGAEMRLIQAEAALIQGNLAEFTAQVNRARAVYGIAPITPPATAGGFEWPNAQDDAWSILDRERYLTLLHEGRRYWDLNRWNHPWVRDNHVTTSRLLEEYGGAIDRVACMPIPDIECDTNAALACPTLR